ncbi:MAG: FAD-binding protein [Polyangiales bacterium]
MTPGSALADALKVTVSENEADRVAYARDLWPRHLVDVREGRAPGTRPQAIVWPKNTEEIAAIVKWCAGEGVPIVPFGAGSGVCGAVLPDERTVVIDLKKMTRWRSLDREAPTLDVEAGAMGITLEEDLQRKGFTIGHFPSSILCSTVGGWIAARGAGQASGKYGKIEDMVVGLEMVDGRGEIVNLRRRRSALDLIPLMVGSEGILGVISSATMRLHPAPSARAFASFGFRTTEGGWEAMRAIFQAGHRPAVARLYDPFDAALARQGSVKRGAKKTGPHAVGAGAKILRSFVSSPRALNALIDAFEGKIPGNSFDAMLILVFEGTADETTREAERARELLRRIGGEDFGEGPAQNWLVHRYSVSYRQPPTVRQGLFLDTMEIASPWSRLSDLYHGVRAALGREVFVMAHLSHAYPDGCSIYFTFAGASGSHDGDLAKYDRVWKSALDAAIAAGGTLSHHHGVGRSKAPKMSAELGLGIDVVKALSRAFDPRGILNPGNLIPRDLPPHPGEPGPSAGIQVDEASLLVRAPADARLEDVEAAAAKFGASLRLDATMLGVTVGAWLEAGCPGAVDTLVDPVDHAVAGVEAKLPDGRILSVRPCPRRAVGPDLVALVVGGKMLAPVSAWLRVHRASASPTSPTSIDPDPAQNDGERSVTARIGVALRS